VTAKPETALSPIQVPNSPHLEELTQQPWGPWGLVVIAEHMIGVDFYVILGYFQHNLGPIN
jgi:hypothetical protein